MQRGPYSNPSPAAQHSSPPLHHPVPQHISNVPNLRSPPPPQPQSQPQATNQYGYSGTPGAAGMGGAPGMGGAGWGGQFGGFNDQTAQLGFHMGKTAFNAVHDNMEQNFNRYVNVSALKHYFNVSNTYVITKLRIVLFPFRHRPWSRQTRISPTGAEGYYLPPREDINSPDMYIPVMAFITYILLSTVVAGLHGSFQPELLGLTFTTATTILCIELLSLKFACYILSIPSSGPNGSSQSNLLDLIAYSGYKFVGVIAILILSEIFNKSRGGGTGGWIGWSIFIYAYLANGLFLLRSLKYVLLPDATGSGVGGGAGASYTVQKSQKSRRTQFLFVYSYVVQFVFMWVLSRQDPAKIVTSSGKGAAR